MFWVWTRWWQRTPLRVDGLVPVAIGGAAPDARQAPRPDDEERDEEVPQPRPSVVAPEPVGAEGPAAAAVRFEEPEVAAE